MFRDISGRSVVGQHNYFASLFLLFDVWIDLSAI